MLFKVDKSKKEELKARKKHEQKVNVLKRDLVNSWVETMAHKGLYNKKNDTFILDKIEYHTFGFTCNIKCRPGLSFVSLQAADIVDMIQANTGYRFNVTDVDNNPQIKKCVFLKDTITLDDYNPIELEAYELYLGEDVYKTPLISDQRKLPNLFLQGAVNMGKTKLIDLMILTLLYNDSKRKDSMVDLYIIQADKYDQAVYNNVKQCRAYADKLEDQAILTSYVYQLVLDTNLKIKPYVSRYDNKKADNFYEFNSLIESKTINEKIIKCSYLIIDEYAGIMPDRETDSYKKQLKEQIQNNVTEIIRLGRSAGIFCIISTQRGTVDMLPPLVKAMCNTLVSFKVNNQSSEQVAGFEGLIGLHPREFKCRIDKEYMASTLTIKKEHYSIIDVCKGNNKLSLKNYDFYLPSSKKKEEKTIEDKLLNTVKKEPTPIPKEQSKNTNTTTVPKQPVKELPKENIPKAPQPANNKSTKVHTNNFKHVTKEPKHGTGYDPNWKPLIPTGDDTNAK